MLIADEEDCLFTLYILQRSSDGRDSSELLALCNVFDTDAKLESAFHHVSPSHDVVSLFLVADACTLLILPCSWCAG
jgi:hypothetical protein